jgi:hypothetical protein
MSLNKSSLKKITFWTIIGIEIVATCYVSLLGFLFASWISIDIDTSQISINNIIRDSSLKLIIGAALASIFAYLIYIFNNRILSRLSPILSKQKLIQLSVAFFIIIFIARIIGISSYIYTLLGLI